MTVNELQQLLAGLPGNLPVVVAVGSRQHNEFAEVKRVTSWRMYQDDNGYPDMWKDDPSCFRRTTDVVFLGTDH